MPTRSFGLVDYKVREAEYFLAQLHGAARRTELMAVQYCTSAFAAAARSVTFAMQSSLSDHPGFGEWYKPRQQALRTDPLARFFHEYRRVTQHIGEQVVSHGSFSGGGAKYYFVATPDLPSVPDLDVCTACTQYYRAVLRLVFECYVELAPVVNAQWRFTSGHFESIGKVIEDAEEELGFPRGYTAAGAILTEAQRWQLLRDRADGCGIERQFWRWLRCRLPLPRRARKSRGCAG